jgi:hypothetical protein
LSEAERALKWFQFETRGGGQERRMSDFKVALKGLKAGEGFLATTTVEAWWQSNCRSWLDLGLDFHHFVFDEGFLHFKWDYFTLVQVFCFEVFKPGRNG